jgi:UDP-N-acetylmuramoyl-tripeptide--D-alanyl-D-alanine ligase
MHFDRNFLKIALPKADLLYDSISDNISFSIDTRTIKKGDIFIALTGKVNDGHQFVKEAVLKGASGLIISDKNIIKGIDEKILNNMLVICVEDTLNALLKLAACWRAKFSYPVVGITGSVGKTSTKEIIANILNLNKMNPLISYGNENSLIGVSLNILKMRPENDIAIIEMGVSKHGEMDILADVVRPTIAIITAVGHSHIEGFGSVSEIAAEKRNIFKYFKEDNIGIINGDQSQLSQIGYIHPVIKFGSKITNQIQARKINVTNSQISFTLKIYKKKYTVVLESNHTGNVFNILAATALACVIGVPNEIILKSIEIPVRVPARFEYKNLKVGKGILIDDCINAGPESVKAALLAFEKIETKSQKVFVFSDMKELGVDSSFWHRQIGRFLRKVPSLGHLILVGDQIKWTKMTIPVKLSCDMVSTWQDAIDLLQNKIGKQESLVLVKGSTSGYTSGLVNLVNHFTNAELVKLDYKQNAKTKELV